MDPLGCAGFGHKHWAGCVVRPCAEGGDGIEPKLRRLTTQQLRLWANKLGLEVRLQKPWHVSTTSRHGHASCDAMPYF
jgi:hypothetical protein